MIQALCEALEEYEVFMNTGVKSGFHEYGLLIEENYIKLVEWGSYEDENPTYKTIKAENALFKMKRWLENSVK